MDRVVLDTDVSSLSLKCSRAPPNASPAAVSAGCPGGRRAWRLLACGPCVARFAARLGYSVRLSKVYLVAEQAVEHVIMPLSLPEAGTPADSFSGKTPVLSTARCAAMFVMPV